MLLLALKTVYNSVDIFFCPYTLFQRALIFLAATWQFSSLGLNFEVTRPSDCISSISRISFKVIMVFFSLLVSIVHLLWTFNDVRFVCTELNCSVKNK